MHLENPHISMGNRQSDQSFSFPNQDALEFLSSSDSSIPQQDEIPSFGCMTRVHPSLNKMRFRLLAV